jgi:hypothetical protein
MLARLGHKVMGLTRIAIGPIALKGLSPGEHRPLSRTEIELLRKAAAGLMVSAPRFYEPGVGRRPSSRASSRHQGRPETVGDSAPRAGGRPGSHRPGRPLRPGPGPAKGKPMPRESMPGKAMPGRPGGARERPGPDRPGPARSRKPPLAQEVSPSLPSSPRLPKAEGGSEPQAERRPGRRVIGLNPRVASQAGLSLAGRPPRKRPAIKRRPPRRVLGVKRPDESDEKP